METGADQIYEYHDTPASGVFRINDVCCDLLQQILDPFGRCNLASRQDLTTRQTLSIV